MQDGKLRKTAKQYTRNSTRIKRNHPLMVMVQSEREHLLSHPLVISLLRHKWNSYGRYVYYLSLLLYIVFLALFTGFVRT